MITDRQISNLNMAAWLLIQSHELVEFKNNGNGVQRGYWIFRLTEGLEADIRQYLAHRARVDPAIYAETLRGMKAAISDR